MKFFLLIILIICGVKINAQSLNLYYLNTQGQKEFLNLESYYNTEEKPKVFFIDTDTVSDSDIYIVDIYRLIKGKYKKIEYHFYKTIFLMGNELKKGFNISGVFTDIISPFVISEGFILSICKSKRNNYLKLNLRSQCESKVEFKILSDC